MRVALFDYGAGNLHSLAKALALAGAGVRVEADPAKLADAELVVLPGVGAFGAAAERLLPGRSALRDAIDDGLACLGICLGMQLLFESSDEGAGLGLGVLRGRVTRIAARRVPHIGWNRLEAVSDPLLRGAPLASAYFANGYACRPEDEACVTAWSAHESDRFPAMVRRGNVVGVQFHPEKSSRAGVAFLAAAVHEAAAASAAASSSGRGASQREEGGTAFLGTRPVGRDAAPSMLSNATSEDASS